jgi:anti-sigma regulatory factor (Ser/Thr protein kinase)
LAGGSPVPGALPVTTDAPLTPPSRPGSDADGKVVLDQEIRAATLSPLREAVLGCASAAGLSRDRSLDVMLAAHELAANVIRHGSGRGRLLLRVTARALSCQVSDARATARPGPDAQREADGTPAAAPAGAWPVEHGHGLWLVRKTADRVQVAAGPAGSIVSIAFNLPTAALPTA